jgi:cobalt-zinc-cadmium efflux system protein
MGHHHHHDHHHHGASGNLKVAFFLNLAFTIFEIIGGLYVNSVAILSDAIHDLGDSLSLGSAWYLQNLSKKKSDGKFSFGYARFSLLGALINSVILVAGSVFVLYEAVGRLMVPESSDAHGMILFAIFGILVNGYAAWKLSGGKTLNERVISWHLLEDVLGWVAILIVAIVLLFKDIQYLDPALSLLITCYILWGVVKRLKETLYLFLQGVPGEIDALEIENKILTIDLIESIHDTHIWSLEGENHVFTTHVKLIDIDTLNQLPLIKSQVKSILKTYPFSHYTVEIELYDEPCDMITNEA